MRLLLPALVLALSIDCSDAFQLHINAKNGLLPSLASPGGSTTILYGQHKFNGGYDASELESSAKWTPKEAAEFVIWHLSDNYEAMGSQLTPLIQNWNGRDLGEFLSRLYLGETTDDFKIDFESHNVRTPQWKGLDTQEGLRALKELLRTALPDGLLEEPVEMANIAEVFLWQERTWPATNLKSGKLEQDSFASLGYTPAIVNIWLELREERGGKRNFLYSAEDVLEMVPTPSKDWGALQLQGMQEFFIHMGIRLAPSCKISLVQGMASSGWNPGKIAKFVSSIPEIAEEDKKINGAASLQDKEDESDKKPKDSEKVMHMVPPPPLEKSHLDNVSSYTKFIKETEDEEAKKSITNDDTKSKDGKIELPAEIPDSMVKEYFADTITPIKNDALDAVRKKIQNSQKSAPWQ